MKKYLKTFAYIFISASFILASCNSTKLPDNLEDSSDIQNNYEENDETSTEKSIDSEDSTQNETSIEINESEENTEYSTDEPEDFDEPLVIDFYPSEDDDEVSLILEEIDTSYDEESENLVEEEPVIELETPAELPQKNENYLSAPADTNLLKENITQTDSITATQDSIEPVIAIKTEISDSNNEVSSEDTSAEIFEEIIVPTRKINVSTGEFLDITYPGLEWKYYGITDNSKDLEFVSQKQSSTNTKFILKAKNSGKKLLHFYKIDFLTGNYIDDYIEVEVTASIEKKSQQVEVEKHTSAPKYKAITNPKKTVKKEESNDILKTSEKAEESNSKTAIENADSEKKDMSPANETTSVVKSEEQNINPKNNTETEPDKKIIQNPSEILIEAEKLFDNQKYSEALDKIKIFLEISQNDRDKALFLQGKILETQSNVRNIKQALNSYNTLISTYPGSRYWDDANKRIIYLKRFYMEGR